MTGVQTCALPICHDDEDELFFVLDGVLHIEMEHRATPEGLVQISRADLAALTGSSESSIKWLMRSLKERGLIRVVTPHTRGRNVGQPPVYQLTYMQRMNRGQEEDAEQKG